MGLGRRCFAVIVLGLGLLALTVVFPCARASAQRTGQPHRVGVLNDAWAANHPAVEGLKAGLRDLGFEEGRDVIFDVKLTYGNPERMAAAAVDLVRGGVDVIFTSTEAATLAAKAATPTIPIVFTLVGDPVAAGLVTSLAQPAGNLTGVSSRTLELVPKRLEVLKALAPQLRRVWMIQSGVAPTSGAAITGVLEVASRLGIEIVSRAVHTKDELEHILDGLRPRDGLLVPDIATMDISAVLLESSLARRVPAVFSSELWVSHGGLISYGADYRGQGSQAARLVAKILHGARPRDLPVEEADRVVLAVNLKTAASFGLTAPRQILFRADVIRR
jgi:putative ABC transport system substrate-binding protein